MSPWNESRRSMGLLYTGVVLAAVGLVTGYLRFVGVIGGGDDEHGSSPSPAATSPAGTPSGTPSSTPTGTASPSDGAEPSPLEVVSWGRARGQLAIVVRNTSDRLIDRARVRITARDEDGAVLQTTTGTPRDVCCTVVGLPPDEEFALFALIKKGVGEIAGVEVTPVSVEDSPPARAATAVVTEPRLLRETDDTIVTATVRARGRLSGYVSVAAVLTDRDDNVAQVISGRFYCFEPGRPREVWLHLFHTVPQSLTLDRIIAHPIPVGVPPHVPGRC